MYLSSCPPNSGSLLYAKDIPSIEIISKVSSLETLYITIKLYDSQVFVQLIKNSKHFKELSYVKSHYILT